MTAREELIDDLRAFADLLERRPDMPVGDYDKVTVQYSLTDNAFPVEAERIAEVERLAALLGVDVYRDERCVWATLDGLGRVEYVVHANTDYGKAALNAEWSYSGVVQPESVGAR